MKTRSTAFDLYASTATNFLAQSLNNGDENDIPRAYLDRYCEQVINAMWRCVSNAIGSYELYGDADGFVFDLEGHIDTYYENDDKRWHGFTEEQWERLRQNYHSIVRCFQMVALDIIEHYLRSVVPYYIEQAVKLKEGESDCQQPFRTFRNMEKIAWLCRDGNPTAKEVYDSFLKEQRVLMHYKEE